jgi:hypothetical protein
VIPFLARVQFRGSNPRLDALRALLDHRLERGERLIELSLHYERLLRRVLFGVWRGAPIHCEMFPGVAHRLCHEQAERRGCGAHGESNWNRPPHETDA